MSEDDDLEVGEISTSRLSTYTTNSTSDATNQNILMDELESPDDVLQSSTSRKDFAPALPDLEKKNQFELYSQKTLS